MGNYEKKYRSLVEAVKMLKEANPSDEGIQNWVKDNVPELKESEDERIKQEIISAVNLYCTGYCRGTKVREDMLAWIEKQGQPTMPTKPTQPTQPEKDEKIRKEIIECVKNYGPSSANPQLFKNMLAWLEKQGKLILANSRKTCKDTWSEEDEMNVKRLILYLSCREKITPEVKSRYIDWLKSLRLQNRWKPSDEQMQQLNIVSKGKGWFDKRPLREMYEQLKKLKENRHEEKYFSVTGSA